MVNVYRNVASLSGRSLACLQRPGERAALDRYGTIWSFFKNQRHTPPSTFPTIAHFRPQLAPRPLGTVLTVRTFATSTLLRYERPDSVPPKPSKDPHEERPPDTSNLPPPHLEHDPSRLENYSKFFRRLALSLPHLHRPTREDFLNAATGFWERFRIRFKWLTIRSFRKYNADDISAFVTWFFMSQTLWLFVGTTTFFSVIFATVNSLQLQSHVAHAISDYLTAETGITIIFESAIVPKWKDSRISIKNVFITRRPSSARLRRKTATGHLAAVGYDVSNHPSNHVLEEEEEDSFPDMSDEDTNYTMFDLNVDSIDVTLSLARWLDGKGVVKDAVIKGVRGVVDRRSVYWDPEHPLDPAAYRHIAQPGDFELDSLQLEDVLVTIYQPGDFRPYTASIFRADMRSFRKQWCFYDFLSAENVVGQFDNCLFSLHKPQSIGRTTEQELKDAQWARMARFRIDGVNVDHLQAMTTQEGPISWITSGKLDAVFDIKFPRDPEHDLPLNAFLGEIADAITTAATSAVADRIPGQRQLAKPPLSAPSDEAEDGTRKTDGPRVVVDIDLRFRDLKAAVPIFTQDLSYTSNALIRPIVAFMNANRTLVPIHCRVVRDLSDFDGSWTMWETGLMDVIADKVYEAMAFHVTQANFNRRVKVVSTWSLHMTTSAILSAMRYFVNPVATHLRDIYKDGFPIESGAVLARAGS